MYGWFSLKEMRILVYVHIWKVETFDKTQCCTGNLQPGQEATQDPADDFGDLDPPPDEISMSSAHGEVLASISRCQDTRKASPGRCSGRCYSASSASSAVQMGRSCTGSFPNKVIMIVFCQCYAAFIGGRLHECAFGGY